MTVASDLAAAAATAAADAALLDAIVNGPESGDASLVSLPDGGTVRTLRRIALESSQVAPILATTWSALSAITGAAANQAAEVPDSDSGTHTDPVVGGTVANAGRYAWSDSPAGWLRVAGLPKGIYDLTSEASSDGLAYTASADASFNTWSIGTLFIFTPNIANAGNVTLNINGIGAKTGTGNTGNNPPAGTLAAGKHYLCQVHSSLFFRILNWDANPEMVNLFLWKNGVAAAQITTTSDGTFSIEALVNGTRQIVARLDQTTGCMRFLYQAGEGPTAGKMARFFSAKTLPETGSLVTNYEQLARDLTGAVPKMHMDGVVPNVIASADTYYLNAGDGEQAQRIFFDGAFLDARFLLQGSRVPVYMDSGNACTIFCGAGTWRGYAAGTNTLVFAAGSLVTIHRVSTNDYFAEVHSGSVSSSSAGVAAICDKTFATAGQSQADRLLRAGGLAGIQERWSELGLTDTVYWVNGASPGSALLKVNTQPGSPDNWWWDPDTSSPGPLATAFVTACNAAVSAGQPAISLIVWEQGEQERFAIHTGTTTPADYLAAHTALFAWLRDAAQLNNATLPIIIVPLGAIDAINANEGTSAVREVQLKYIASDAHAYQGHECYDCLRPDNNIHRAFAGQRTEGRRLVDVIGNVLYSQTNALGPSIVAVTEVDSQNYKVEIDPGDVSFLKNVDAGEYVNVLGFAFCSNDDAVSATYYSVDYAFDSFNSGTGYHEITFTLTEAHSGARLVYPFGELADGRTGRFVRGFPPANLPLRSWNGMP